MSWNFSINKLKLGNDALGIPFIVATATQNIHFRIAGEVSKVLIHEAQSFHIIQRWQTQVASVEIYPHDTSKINIDPANEGLVDLLVANPERSFAKIIRFNEEESEICASIYFPKRRFRHIWRMAENLLTSQQDLSMNLAIESVIFGVTIKGDPNTPVFDDFLRGKPYIGTEIFAQLLAI